MLRNRRRTSGASLLTNAGVDLKAGSPIGVNHFHRRRVIFARRIRALRTEHIVSVHYQRNRRNCLQVVQDGITVKVDGSRDNLVVAGL